MISENLRNYGLVVEHFKKLATLDTGAIFENPIGAAQMAELGRGVMKTLRESIKNGSVPQHYQVLHDEHLSKLATKAYQNVSDAIQAGSEIFSIK